MIQHNQIPIDNDLYSNRQYHQMQSMLVVLHLFHFYLDLFDQFFAIKPIQNNIQLYKCSYKDKMIDYHAVHYITLSIQFKDNSQVIIELDENFTMIGVYFLNICVYVSIEPCNRTLMSFSHTFYSHGDRHIDIHIHTIIIVFRFVAIHPHMEIFNPIVCKMLRVWAPI